MQFVENSKPFQMTEKQYREYQQKIRELCLSLGLVEVHRGYEIQFRTEVKDTFVFGEVVRLFDYDDHPTAGVVFFNSLKYTEYMIYDYCYEYDSKKLPFETPYQNMFNFTEKIETILDKLKIIIVEAIRQRKELDLKLKMENLQKDFK